MRPTNSDGFTIREVELTENGFTYSTFRVTGNLNGRRIRKQFKSEEEAEGEKARLEVQAANADGQIHTVLTRLSDLEIRDAETATALLGNVPLSVVARYYLASYRPPLAEKSLVDAKVAFIADRTPHIRKLALRDYNSTLDDFLATHPGRTVGSITTGEVKTFLESRGWGPKTFNNKRGDLAAFFAYCVKVPQKWASENPVAPIAKFKITRGIPEIITVKTAADLMAFVETYRGGVRSKLPAGCLAGYFALALFAGLRPSVPGGEIWKLAKEGGGIKLIDLDLAAIRITPAISKVKSVRQVKIRPNLAAWLKRYPLDQYPLIPTNTAAMLTEIREKYGLGDDVMRHTFISMHVAAHKSMGEAALEAGNSESMIKKHYLNLVSEVDATAFWNITPVA